MAHQRKRLGDWGEEVASTHLATKGFQILHRQWRCSWGEMDLIVKRNDILVFVEVKTRSSRTMGAPEHGITPAKAKKLQMIALAYMGQHDLDLDWQIDMVAIEMDRAGNLKRCEHIENVVVAW